MTTSKRAIRVICLFGFGILTVLAYLGYDYYHLKKISFQNNKLLSSLTTHQEEINTQRRHIQRFADEINVLKSKLSLLQDSEHKIRVIAKLEAGDGQAGFFGMGGSLPEDMDTNLDLTAKHNSLLREMHEQVDHLHAAIEVQREDFRFLLKHLQDQRNILASTPAIKPTDGWITSRFGYRTSPFTGEREFHKGLDIATRKKTAIIATADGVITFIGRKGFLGKVVIIDHGYGLVTRYAHIHKTMKKQGEAVKRGETVALVGSTGRTTGPHLHYEVLLNGVPVNPERYILD